MIADYWTALQLIWISSVLNLIVPGAEVRGMSIGVRLVLSGCVSAVSLSLSSSFHYSLTLIHTGICTACAHTGKCVQSSLFISQTNRNTWRAPLSPRKHAHTDIQWVGVSMVQSRHRSMKNACPFACFIRNTHRDSIPIAAEIPRRNINYTGNLGGGVGRNGAEREYGMLSVTLMRGSLSPAALGPDYKIQVGPNVLEIL